jgi:SM-20-related protein
MSIKPFIHVMEKLAPNDVHQAVWETCMSKNWFFGHGSGNDSGVSFWKMDLDNDPATSKLWQAAQPGCEEKIGRPLKVLRQYANGHTYGLGGGIHQDDRKEDTYTLLYYPMLGWENNWDGETVYQDQNGEVVLAVKPAPNRGILFDASIPHVERAPSRFYGGLRVTVAFKLIVADVA